MINRAKFITVLLLALIALNLIGCGLYDKDYLAVNDYVISDVSGDASSDKINVSSFAELKKSIGWLVNEGKQSGVIVFSENYSGEPSDDLSDACWQVRSQDALCAYCVSNISYELTRIVSYDEASITITYAQTGVDFSDINQIGFVSGISPLISKALDNHEKSLVILVNSSTYNSDEIVSLVHDNYYKNPLNAPKEPGATVQVYSGTGNQKLYAISLHYYLSDEKLESEIDELKGIRLYEPAYESDLKKIKAIKEYLCTNCETGEDDSIYSALIEKSGNSKAIALAAVALCNQMTIPCMVVEGQRNYSNHFWNIVEIDGNCYHFDAYSMIENPGIVSILKTDAEMWNEYRWDTSSYPKCDSPLPID